MAVFDTIHTVRFVKSSRDLIFLSIILTTAKSRFPTIYANAKQREEAIGKD